MNTWKISLLLLANFVCIHAATLENNRESSQQPSNPSNMPYSTIYSTYSDPNGMYGVMSASTSAMNQGPAYTHSSLSASSNNDLGTAASNSVYTMAGSNALTSTQGNSNQAYNIAPVYAMERQGMPQQYNYATPQNGIAPPYTMKDPGFSVQTGFEGFLVPNPWYGLVSWGIEGVIIAIVGVVVFLAVKVAIIFLIFKLLKFGKLFKDEDGGDGLEEAELRSYLPSYMNRENLNYVTNKVFEAIDRYNEIIMEEKEE